MKMGEGATYNGIHRWERELVGADLWWHPVGLALVEGRVDDRTVVERDVSGFDVRSDDRVLAPVILELLLRLSLQWLTVVELVESVWEVVTSVGSTGFLKKPNLFFHRSLPSLPFCFQRQRLSGWR